MSNPGSLPARLWRSAQVRRSLLTLALLGLVPAAQALTAAKIFSDHMVLQRQQPVRVWGIDAAPEGEVTVEVKGPDGEMLNVARGRADAAGKWTVTLPPFPRAVSTPLLLRVSDARNERLYRDVLVGDVWLCGGQSNMNMTLAHNAHRDPEHPFKHVGEKGGWQMPDYAARIDDGIRHFGVEHVARTAPLEELADEFDQDPWPGNEWQRADCAAVGGFTAAGYYFARACRQALLASGQDVPIGILRASWGATFIETWMSAEALASRPEFAPLVEKRKALVASSAAQALAAGKGEAAAQRFDSHRPSAAFNAMVHPLRPFAVRGFVWYQGENNTRDHAVYGEELRALIRDWRAQWGGEARPFIWVQLPGVPRAMDQGENQMWPRLREAQTIPLQEPATAMVVALDLGSKHPTPRNTDMEVHPRTKEALGRRLALTALQQFYGQEIFAESPRCVRVEREGGALRLFFATDGAGLATAEDAALTGFELAGSDGIFRAAESMRIEGESVVVASREVAAPQSVRYAWSNLGRGNLASARRAFLPQPDAPPLMLGRLPVGTFRASVSEPVLH